MASQDCSVSVPTAIVLGTGDDALEALEPRTVARGGKEALGELEELADPGQDAAAVKRFIQALSAVRAQASARVAREANSRIEQAVTQRITLAPA